MYERVKHTQKSCVLTGSKIEIKIAKSTYCFILTFLFLFFLLGLRVPSNS